MKTNNLNFMELIEYPRSGILSKDIAKSGGVNVTLFCMASGSEIGDHTSTKEGFVFVVEGKGTFVLEGEKITMQPGVFIRMKRNAVHSLSAEESTSFVLVLCGSK